MEAHFLVWLNRLPWEAWTAFGTWILALATWALAIYTRNLVRRSQEDAQAQIATIRDAAKAQVEAAQQAAKDQTGVTERMTTAHIRMLQEQIKAVRETAKAQVEAAQQAAKEQTELAERMAKTHVETLREDLRARLLLHYETRWDSADMIAQRQRLAGLLLPSVATNVPPYPMDEIPDAVPNFFETIGLLCERGQLDTQMVWKIFGYYARRYGQMLGPFFGNDQKVHGDQSLWSGFLNLIETLRTMDQKYAKDIPHSFSGDEIKRFFREETQAR